MTRHGAQERAGADCDGRVRTSSEKRKSQIQLSISAGNCRSRVPISGSGTDVDTTVMGPMARNERVVRGVGPSARRPPQRFIGGETPPAAYCNVLERLEAVLYDVIIDLEAGNQRRARRIMQGIRLVVR